MMFTETETNAANTPTPLAMNRCTACQTATPIFAFTMAFQPIIDVQTRRITAHEALVRGLDGAGAAAVLSRVNADNLYAFDQACRVRSIELAARLGMAGRLNINFLPNAVYQPRACIRATLEAARRTGFRANRLTFEIVETEAIADIPHLTNIIAEYRRQGFKIAMDDFGSGHSNLARLAALRPDIVKIDRALVANCDHDQTKLTILASIIALCAGLGITAVLEGLERDGEVEAARGMGGRFMQGFYFSRPVFEGLARVRDVFPQ